MIWCISFSTFSDVLTAFTCAKCYYNLWSVCIGVNILIPLPFGCLLKLKIFSTVLIIFFGFSFSGISLLLIRFLKSINPSSLVKSFAENDGFRYLK